MKKNIKGFTLIELLAVIVILGIVIAIAIPGINMVIISSRKKAFVESAKLYIGAVRNTRLSGEYRFPNQINEVLIVGLDRI